MSSTELDPSKDQNINDQNETRDISAAILFMIFLLVVNEYILHRLILFKERFPQLAFLQGSSFTTLLGILSGVLLNLTEIVDIVKIIKQGFSEFFLIVLLPPILYESAINMERKYFFKNFGSILGYAVGGTLLSILLTALMIYFIGWLGIATNLGLNGSVAFGALISATDPVAILSIFKELSVDKNLFALIFGESILNDAVPIIIYNTTLQLRGESGDGIFWKAISNFLTVFLGSILIGLLIGIITAYTLKNREKSDDESQSNTELTLLFLIPWVSYLIGEGLKMSGIVSIVFCGIAMARYALPNVSENARKVNKRLYSTLAYSFENLVFIFIGIGFVSFDLAWKEMGVSLFIFSLIIIKFSRYLHIEFISYLLNKYRSKNKINKVYRFIMWFSGFRGAMAYALSMKSSEQYSENSIGRIMLTLTLLLANINIFVHASMLLPLALKYKIQQSFDILDEQNQNQEDKEQSNVQYKGFWSKVKEIFVMFDENCLQKLLLVEETDIDKSMTNLSPRSTQNKKDKRANSYDESPQKYHSEKDMKHKRRSSLKLSFAGLGNNQLITSKKEEKENQEDYEDQMSQSHSHKNEHQYTKDRSMDIKFVSKKDKQPRSQNVIEQTNQSKFDEQRKQMSPNNNSQLLTVGGFKKSSDEDLKDRQPSSEELESKEKSNKKKTSHQKNDNESSSTNDINKDSVSAKSFNQNNDERMLKNNSVNQFGSQDNADTEENQESNNQYNQKINEEIVHEIE